MTKTQGQGVSPHLYRILHGAIKAPMEYAFETKSAATTARHKLYTARRKLARQGDPLSAAFDLLSITAPQERQRADGSGTEWYWRIGESVLHDTMQAQLEAQCEEHGIDPMSLDRQPEFGPRPSIPLAPAQVYDTDANAPPPLPEHSSHETDKAMAGYVPPPRPLDQRESTSSILDEMAASVLVIPDSGARKCKACNYVWREEIETANCPSCGIAV